MNERLNKFIREMGWVPSTDMRQRVRQAADRAGLTFETRKLPLPAAVPMSEAEVRQWASVCNSEAARQVLHDYLRLRSSPPPSAPVGVEDESVRVGNLPTMNQDGYPGLGEWWVQLWRGDEIIARVYGDGSDEVRSQAQDIADALNQQPAAVDTEILRTAIEYHYGQAEFPRNQYGNSSHRPNPKLQAWNRQVAKAIESLVKGPSYVVKDPRCDCKHCCPSCSRCYQCATTVICGRSESEAQRNGRQMREGAANREKEE